MANLWTQPHHQPSPERSNPGKPDPCSRPPIVTEALGLSQPYIFRGFLKAPFIRVRGRRMNKNFRSFEVPSHAEHTTRMGGALNILEARLLRLELESESLSFERLRRRLFIP